MEKGSMIGLGLCLVGVFVSATLHGINIAFLFMEFGSIIIVVFGHLGATIALVPLGSHAECRQVRRQGDEGQGRALRQRHD